MSCSNTGWPANQIWEQPCDLLAEVDTPQRPFAVKIMSDTSQSKLCSWPTSLRHHRTCIFSHTLCFSCQYTCTITEYSSVVPNWTCFQAAHTSVRSPEGGGGGYVSLASLGLRGVVRVP